MKRHFSDYVRHCLRFYVSTLEVGSQPKFKNNIEKANWMCCHEVLSKLEPDDLKMVQELYTRGDTMADKIYTISKEMRISQSYIWSLVDDIEYKVAQKRGLI